MNRIVPRLALATLAGCVQLDEVSSPVESYAHAGQIVVLTQNQYLGADLTPIIAAPDAAAFNHEVKAALDQIAANNFPERANALAREIARTNPDVVALQEVFRFTLNGQLGDPPYRDHLLDLQRALVCLGRDYVVVAQDQDMNVTIPVDFDDNGAPDAAVGVTDRDVVLVRSNVAAYPAPLAAACARPSGDGCNYQVVATAPTAVGPLAVERGFVGVDVGVRGRAYRVVDTHLEVPDLDPTNPLSAAIQAAQAQELIATLAATTPANRSLIVLGDTNSSPDDPIITVGDVTIVPPYIQLAAAGFTDAFLVDDRMRDGFTCCQAENLRNAESQLAERIDQIFSASSPARARVDILGAAQGARTPSGLWPSDHAALSSRLSFGD